MKKLVFLSFFLSVPSFAVNHPFLITSSNSYTAMISSSAASPWLDIKNQATTFLGSGLGIYGFASGNPLTDPGDLENQMIELQGINALLYTLNTGNSGSITYRTNIKGMLNGWDALWANYLADPTSYNANSPLNGAFFSSVLALDVIWNDLTPAEQNTYTVEFDSFTIWNRSHPSSWIIANYAGEATWSVFRGTSSAQIAIDTAAYHNALFYPGTTNEPLLNLNGGFAEGSLYGWARIGGDSVEKEAKWGFKFVAQNTGVDTSFFANQYLGNYYNWQYAGEINPFNWRTSWADTNCDYPLGGNYWDGTHGLTYTLAASDLTSVYFSSAAASLATRFINIAPKPAQYPDSLLMFMQARPLATSTPSISYVLPYQGAAFWDNDQSSYTLQGILWNARQTMFGHLHQEQNSLYLAAYGEVLMSDAGYFFGAPVQTFPTSWSTDSAFSNSVALIGNQNFRSNLGPDGIRPTGGGYGMIQYFTSSNFDYASGASTSAYGLTGTHTRNFLMQHTADGANGYWISLDELVSSTYSSVNTLWHGYSNVVATTTASTEWRWSVSDHLTSTTTLNLFLGTPPASVSFSSGVFSGRGGLTNLGSYLNASYNVDGSQNARMATILYPSDATHSKATMAQIAPSGATGASITSGSVVDYVLISSNSADVTQAGCTYRGLGSFFRKVGTPLVSYFVRQGTKFDDGQTVRTGYSSPVGVSLYMRGASGAIWSTGTAVTIYAPGVTGVSVDGTPTSGTAGNNSFTFSVSAGSHTIGLGAGIFPVVPVVSVGNTISFTSSNTVTWSLKAGSTGTIDATSGLYTAPRSFTPHNLIDGCMALPNDHDYNVKITSLPVDVNSAARIANILGGTSAYIQVEVSFPHNPTTNTTPTQTMDFFYTTNNNGLQFPILPAPYTGVETNLYPQDYGAQDRHILGVNTDTCQFYELYNYYPVGTATGSGCPTCNSQSGVTYAGTSYQLPDDTNGNGGSTDAAGAYVDPLAFRYSELKAGIINHALRFTLANGYIASSFTWPATNNATPGCTPLSSCVQYGARFRLKADFDISSYSPTTQVILRALKDYGMFMDDGGTSMHIQAASDVFTDTTTYAAIQSEIRFGNIASQWRFDIVDQSSLKVSSATGKIAIPNTYNVMPDIFAEVVATQASGSSQTVRVALQPVMVGTKNTPFPAQAGAMSVMAGTPQFQIPYWVNGSSVTSVTCTMNPTLGTLSSSCLYTSPPTQVSLATTAVTITPTADPTQSITFPLVVFPSTGIRVNVGGKSNANNPTPPYDAAGNFGPDPNGNYWWSNPIGNIPPWYTKVDGYFPQSSWPSSTTLPTVGLYYTYYQAAQDGSFSAMVPNGNYNLTLGFGGDPSSTSIGNVFQAIDTQGTIVISSTAFATIRGVTNYNPVTTSISVTVSNNQFYFALRDISTSSGTLINNWSLVSGDPPPPTPTVNSKILRGFGKLTGGGKLR